MKQKNPLVILLFIFLFNYGFSQSVVNTTGNTLGNASVSIEYSVGEIVTTTLSNASNTCNQGLLQPNNGNLGTGVRDIIPIRDIKFYSDNISVVAITSHKLYVYQLVDVSGRVLQSGNVPATYRWNIQPLASGIYFLRVLDKQNHSATYKFPKQ